ncbi:hypothetical protein B0H17DRAFT_1206450 [Mycena rosella]|uniref:Uncharacterized protein n=1 Tax=Mycena rosella TaxID=1033263 RepID=A0AAD7D5F3_MYCRO|nr:hypothetical protein B0H17DRAFT_1206450 [Mycena rosella]
MAAFNQTAWAPRTPPPAEKKQAQAVVRNPRGPQAPGPSAEKGFSLRARSLKPPPPSPSPSPALVRDPGGQQAAAVWRVDQTSSATNEYSAREDQRASASLGMRIACCVCELRPRVRSLVHCIPSVPERTRPAPPPIRSNFPTNHAASQD